MACLLYVPRAAGLLLACCIAICGCTTAVLRPNDRWDVCQVAVDEKFGSSVFRPNSLRHPAGVARGVAGGALAGLIYGPMGIVMLTAAGVAHGAACTAASQSHPDAEANFEKIVKSADAGSLKRGLEANLNAPRASCGRTQANVSAAAKPDTIVEIEKVGVMMGCSSAKQEYHVTVNWRVITADSRRWLAQPITFCEQTSFKDVDDWSADPDQARVEIERVLTKTGQRMAAELLASGGPNKCRFQSSKTGEIEER
jgi:hypothetical protein